MANTVCQRSYTVQGSLMADDIDLVQEHVLAAEEVNLLTARRLAAEIPVGKPGECSDCGEDSPRLVADRCARCRDAGRHT